MSWVLTFDLGTTYFKVCLFDESLRLVARQRVPVPLQQQHSGRVELPVPVFERCLTEAVHDVSRQAGGVRDVKRICFACQANSFTLLDSNSRPLIPFILWTDVRAQGLEAFLQPLTGRSDFYATTGVAQLDHYFMPAKIRWLQKHQPHIIAQSRKLCSMSDYLVWWLTGKHLTEAGLAGLTGLVNIHRLAYWSDALRHLELPFEWLPPIVRAGTDAGPLRRDIAQQWGLPFDCQVVMGCLDQYAGAIGADNIVPGRVSETTGTVLATIRCADEFSPDAAPGVFHGPGFAPAMYYQMVFSSVSAGLLEKYRNDLPDRPTFAELDELAAEVPAGAQGLRLHPEAANLPAVRMFVDRAERHGRGHEVRAIMEAIAFELRRQIEVLCLHQWPTSVRAMGGAANSRLWLKIKSQVIGCPVEAVDCPEPTSLGAARLAQMRP